ncbi:hypothetical protein OQA88_3110 [Cercophora sp. LCS_1]
MQSNSRCLVCRAIIKLLRTTLGDLALSEASSTTVTLWDSDGLIVVFNHGGTYLLLNATFQLYRETRWGMNPEEPHPLIPWPALKPSRTLLGGPQCTMTSIATLISVWMDECESKHQECRREQEPELPTRLIKIDAVHEHQVRLCETAQKQTGRYAALSHCWGARGHHPPITTRTNLEERKRTIMVKNLGATFSDAIQLCRALGILYIWIDSLCIIQDDLSDWATEASKMARVYQNAWLTISADGAPDSRAGLVQTVSNRQFPSLKLRLKGSRHQNSSSETYYGRRTNICSLPDKPTDLVTYTCRDIHRIDDDDRTEHLRKRGWAFQEWILSRRIIHLCEGEMLWECREAEACECQQGMATRPKRRPKAKSHARQWKSYVEGFTARQLTHDTDRLPALAGVARSSQLVRSPRDRYIAGHWESELPLSMLWTVDVAVPLHGTGPAHRPRFGREYAPSWSWASVPVPVKYEGFGLDDRSFLRGVGCVVRLVGVHPGTRTTENPFGPVRGASVNLESSVLRLKIKTWKACGHAKPPSKEGCGEFQATHGSGNWRVVCVPDVWEEGETDLSLLVFSKMPTSVKDGRSDGGSVGVSELLLFGFAIREEPQGSDCFVRVGFLRLLIRVWRRLEDSVEPDLDDVLTQEFQMVRRAITLV